MLAAGLHLAASCRCSPRVYGAGCDGELTPAEVLERIAALGRAGALLGSWGLTPVLCDQIEAAANVVPTEASMMGVRCARGETGPAPIRARPAQRRADARRRAHLLLRPRRCAGRRRDPARRRRRSTLRASPRRTSRSPPAASAPSSTSRRRGPGARSRWRSKRRRGGSCHGIGATTLAARSGGPPIPHHPPRQCPLEQKWRIGPGYLSVSPPRGDSARRPWQGTDGTSRCSRRCSPPLAAPAAAAPAPEPYGTNAAGGFRAILPPGANGFVNGPQLLAFQAAGTRPPHNTDQLAPYSDLLFAAPGLSAGNIGNYFHDAGSASGRARWSAPTARAPT